MPRLRALLLTVVAVAATAVGPVRAADPLFLVAGRADGALVHVTLVGRVAYTREVIPAPPSIYHAPTQAVGTRISFTAHTDTQSADRYDVGVADAESNEHRRLTRDGRSAHLLLSPDGRWRYVLTMGRYGALTSLVRTDAAGRNRKALVPARRTARGDVRLSGTALSPDGRTIYLARTVPGTPSAIYAVDTTTGRLRALPVPRTYGFVYNVAISPDGRMLAISYAPTTNFETTEVAVVRLDGSLVQRFEATSNVTASAFTPSGLGVVLTRELLLLDHHLAGLSIGDLTTGAVQPVAGSAGLFHAIPIR
ncbi:MAG TPA: hypothetical protein VNA20_03445 [Frankiaceae bacterium]|nr:hypothetical protein [Frankiaceae bacterium]